MDKGAFPFPEYFPLYRVTYKASVAYTGVTGRVRIEKVTSVAQGGESGVSGATVHNSLSGRDAIDAHPALSITDIYNLTNGALLKKISTGVVAATAADLPAHASRHHYGGSDALTGQSIGGLRVSDKPTFAGLISKVTGTATDIDFYSLGGYRQMSFRWSDTSQQLELFSSNDTGVARANRMLIPRSSSSPVSILLGLTVTGTTTLDTSLSGMLKATAGVVSAASASDLPLHASRHHSGGSDPLAGQSIAGLLTNSVPTFAGLNLKVSGTAADLNYQSLAGVRQMSVRWSDASQQIEVFSSNDAGGSRSNRMLIPRADASPVQILLGLKITGTTTLDTSLTGMLKATAGVVSVAGASDLPAHASLHQWDGADPIQGQLLLGLRAHETPSFGGIQSGSVTGYLPIRGNTGVEIARFNADGFISYGDITLSGDLSIANLSGVLYAANGRVRVAIGADLPAHTHYTTDVSEGTNLWFTYQRARDAISGSHPMSVVNGVVLHADTDGYRHVPANGTTNSGKFLVSGGSAGSYTWETIAAGSLPVHAFRHHYNGSDPLAGQSIAGLLISSSPEFAGLKIGSISGILKATAGVVGVASASDIPDHAGSHYWDGGDSIQGQSLAGLLPSSSPAFAGLTVGSLTGMIKATAGVLSVASGSDIPDHGSRHHYTGADPITGQLLSGLLVTSTPRFNGVNLQGATSDYSSLRFYDNSGVLKHQIFRASNSNGGVLSIVGASLTDYRITIPSLGTLPIEIDGGMKFFSGDLTLNTSLNGMLKATSGLVGIAGESDLPGGPYLPLAGGKRISGWVAFDAVLYATDSIGFSGYTMGQLGMELYTAYSIYGDVQYTIESPTNIDNVVSFESKGTFKFKPKLFSSGFELPVLGAQEVIMLVGDTGADNPYYWYTATQNVRYRDGGATVSVSAGGNAINVDARGKCMILVGPTTNSSDQCSLYIV
ncbi:MAG: hypothetical protein IPM06_18505 [Rhizobiales bacterium]|nr:hypothetical protein [Hyphomicrobiales bacterium]